MHALPVEAVAPSLPPPPGSFASRRLERRGVGVPPAHSWHGSRPARLPSDTDVALRRPEQSRRVWYFVPVRVTNVRAPTRSRRGSSSGRVGSAVAGRRIQEVDSLFGVIAAGRRVEEVDCRSRGRVGH